MFLFGYHPIWSLIYLTPYGLLVFNMYSKDLYQLTLFIID